MSSDLSSNQRDAFELWAEGNHWNTRRNPYNQDMYQSDYTQYGWWAWKAARAAVEPTDDREEIDRLRHYLRRAREVALTNGDRHAADLCSAALLPTLTKEARRFCCFEDCDGDLVEGSEYCAGHLEQERQIAAEEAPRAMRMHVDAEWQRQRLERAGPEEECAAGGPDRAATETGDGRD